MNEQSQKATRQDTWTVECESFEKRVSYLKEVSNGLRNFAVVGGELDQLPSGFAASVVFELGGAVLCITAHSLTASKAQMLVYQNMMLWLRFQQNETE